MTEPCAYAKAARDLLQALHNIHSIALGAASHANARRAGPPLAAHPGESRAIVNARRTGALRPGESRALAIRLVGKDANGGARAKLVQARARFIESWGDSKGTSTKAKLLRHTNQAIDLLNRIEDERERWPPQGGTFRITWDSEVVYHVCDHLLGVPVDGEPCDFVDMERELEDAIEERDAAGVPAKCVPSKRVPSKRVPSKRVPSKRVPSKRVPSKRVKRVAARTRLAAATTDTTLDSKEDTPPLQYVTLLQAAGLARQNKKTLERWLKDGKLPKADVVLSKGKANKWNWEAIRPALERELGHELPRRFPSLAPEN